MQPDLLNLILTNSTINSFLCEECAENGVAIKVDPSLILNEDYLIIKLDSYYQENVKGNPPPSPDCLIIQRCKTGKYVLIVVELKDIENLGNYSTQHIKQKFETCLQDFLSNRYREYFYELSFDFVLRLFFITSLTIKQKDKMKTTRLDNLLALPPCTFANRKYLIEHKVPDPIVRPC